MTMMTTEITHSCGCAATIEHSNTARGTQKVDRQRGRPCTQCWKKEQNAAAETHAKANNLPPLTGSEKQINWAMSIRHAAIMSGTHDIATASQITAAKVWIDGRPNAGNTGHGRWKSNSSKKPAATGRGRTTPPAGPPPVPAPSNEWQAPIPVYEGDYSLMLTHLDGYKVDMIKAIRAATGASLKDSKAMVDYLPSQVMKGISETTARQYQSLLTPSEGDSRTRATLEAIKTSNISVHPTGVTMGTDTDLLGMTRDQFDRLDKFRTELLMRSDELDAEDLIDMSDEIREILAEIKPD